MAGICRATTEHEAAAAPVVSYVWATSHTSTPMVPLPDDRGVIGWAPKDNAEAWRGQVPALEGAGEALLGGRFAAASAV
jgi:hypothetical protein